MGIEPVCLVRSSWWQTFHSATLPSSGCQALEAVQSHAMMQKLTPLAEGCPSKRSLKRSPLWKQVFEWIKAEVNAFKPTFWGGEVLLDKNMDMYKALGQGKVRKLSIMTFLFGQLCCMVPQYKEAKKIVPESESNFAVRACAQYETNELALVQPSVFASNLRLCQYAHSTILR